MIYLCLQNWSPLKNRIIEMTKSAIYLYDRSSDPGDGVEEDKRTEAEDIMENVENIPGVTSIF